MKVPENRNQFPALRDSLHILARAWSPRPTARLDTAGTHNYGTVTTLTSTPPTVPWAMYLYTGDKQLGILAVDFDDHPGADPRRDCADLSNVLRSLACPHWITASSGPTSHGRHVWIPLSQPWTAKAARRTADALARRYRSADISALRNPSTGCLRPAGAAHRSAAPSTVIAVIHPADTTASAVFIGDHRAPERLPDALPLVLDDTAYGTATSSHATIVTTDPPLVDAALHAASTVLTAGQTDCATPQLSGTSHADAADQLSDLTATNGRRSRPRAHETTTEPSPTTPVPAPAEDLAPGATTFDELPEWLRSRILHAPAGDTNTTEFQVLRALAQHRWTDAMVLELAATRPPAFTHSQSQSLGGPVRRPRSDRLYRRHLLRQWERAQHSLTTHPARAAMRPLEPVTEVVARLQHRADRDPALQMTDGTAAVRRVLDTVCLRALAARTTTISIGVRDVAATAGIRSHQQAADALRELRHRGYLSLTAPSDGPNANTYELLAPPVDESWTQGGTTALGLHQHLTTKLALFRHDILLHPGLGERAGLILWAATHGARTETTLATTTEIPLRALRPRVQLLRELKLLGNRNTPRLSGRSFTAAARTAGVAGAWVRRLFVWRLQQLRWRWWLAELAFLTALKHHKRLVLLTQPTLSEHGRYPRTATGLPDHHRALTLMRMSTPAPTEVAA